MWLRMGGPAIEIRLIVFLSLLKGNFSLFDTYLVVFVLFLPKTEKLNCEREKKYIYYLMSKCG